jgi:prophage tail gpP-like protein
LIYVSDEVCNVEGEFLVKSIKYSKSLSGTFCDLVLVNPLAYTDSVFEIKAKAGKKKRKTPTIYLGE